MIVIAWVILLVSSKIQINPKLYWILIQNFYGIIIANENVHMNSLNLMYFVWLAIPIFMTATCTWLHHEWKHCSWKRHNWLSVYFYLLVQTDIQCFPSSYKMIPTTVKPVYKDHPREIKKCISVTDGLYRQVY